VTINPAKQLGIDDRVGSIEKGKDADLVIFDRHPLSIYAVVQKTIVDGKTMFDRAVDLEARPRLAAEKKALEEKLGAAAKGGAGAGGAERKPTTAAGAR
jgi:adenine deaminase